MLDREQLQDELAAGADGDGVEVEERADLGALQYERLDELRGLGARIARWLHLGEDHLHAFLGKACGGEARLGEHE